MRRIAHPPGELFRRTPLGVMILGALLALLGAGFVLSGVYLLLAGRALGWVAAAAALALGPLVLYAALQLVRLRRWAWTAMLALLALLLVSSVARALAAPPLPFAPLAELAAEVGVLLYLTRERIRRAFAPGAGAEEGRTQSPPPRGGGGRTVIPG